MYSDRPVRHVLLCLKTSNRRACCGMLLVRWEYDDSTIIEHSADLARCNLLTRRGKQPWFVIFHIVTKGSRSLCHVSKQHLAENPSYVL